MLFLSFAGVVALIMIYRLRFETKGTGKKGSPVKKRAKSAPREKKPERKKKKLETKEKDEPEPRRKVTKKVSGTTAITGKNNNPEENAVEDAGKGKNRETRSNEKFKKKRTEKDP
jgi:hypothetical protein